MILIVEDERKLAELERDYFTAAGYEVAILNRGDEVSDWLANQEAELIVLDIMLPGKDGISLCREIRQTSRVPIIMTTARVEEIDRLLGLELGADDYLCKPFSPRELVARVKAVLRRAQPESVPTAGLTLKPNTNQIVWRNKTMELTTVEFRLLETLMKKPGIIFSRDQLMDLIYADGRIVSDRTIDSHVKKLRRRLNDLSPEKEFVRSVYGAGYKYEI